MQPLHRRAQGCEDLRELLVGQPLLSLRQPAGLGGAHVSADRLDVEPELRSDRFLTDARHPQPECLSELQHGDLAIGHRPSSPDGASRVVGAKSRAL